jgi:hypothetical protein
MQISFAMLSLSRPGFQSRATVGTDQCGNPERIGDTGTKILFGGDGSRPHRLPGGGPPEKSNVLPEISRRKEFVTASADLAGGAVPILCALIASILSGPVVRSAG